MPSTYEPIATTTLGSASANITFSSISSAFTDLRLVVTYTTTTAGQYSYLQFNGITTTTYSDTYLAGDGAAAFSGADTSASFIAFGSYQSPSSTTIPCFATADIFSYAGSTNKTVLNTSSMDKNGSGDVERIVGLWRSTAAITSIAIKTSSSTFAAGTTATLYGIKNA
jgi:hypothetical protein